MGFAFTEILKKQFINYLALLLFLVSGCAFSNEGAIDYRRAELFSATSEPKDKDPIAPSKLFRKNLPALDANARIEKLDKLSVRLRDGFLKDCNERLRSPLRGFRKNCEIAILFKVFEIGEGNDFKFQPGAERDARLVYFSPDLAPGQHYNLHNMSVYGPIEYKGKPLAIDIKIVEIDAEDKQAFAMLKTIAAIGARAYAPAAPVLGVLEGIGGALTSSGTDDIEWRYTMVLDPSGGYSGHVYGTMEAGDYVFIREETRDATTRWETLRYDHNTGRIWIDSPEGLKPFTDNSYLTVQILKGAGNEDIILEQNTYGPFRDALERETNNRIEEFQKNVAPQLMKVGEARVRARNFNRAQQLYEGMLTDNKSNNVAGAANKAFDLCRALLDASKTLADPKTKETANLDLEQIDYLLRRLRTHAKMSDPDQLARFTPAGFAKITEKDCVAAVTKADASTK